MTASPNNFSARPTASSKRTCRLQKQRDALFDFQLDLMFRLAPQWKPLLRLIGTDTGFASLDTERLSATAGLKPDCSWLGLVRDDEGLDIGHGPSAFDGTSLSWLLRRADVVAVFSGIRSSVPYSRFASLALAGHRVVIIETKVHRQHDWIIETKRLSRAPVVVISRETQDAEICIWGAEPINSGGREGASS
jgi:hypothetical protein